MKKNVFVKPDEQRELVHSVVARKGRMKSNMKKLLVIVMALMPSLSILAMNPSGYDLMPEPDDIPITPMPDPFPGHEPRIMSVGDNNDNDGGPIDLGLGGVRPRNRQDIDPNLIPIKPCPSPGTGHEPRIRNVVQDPECYHYDGVVYIYADSNVAFISATITRIGDNLTWTGSASTNTLSISVSAAIGVYRLELTLSDGRSFIGEYIIE